VEEDSLLHRRGVHFGDIPDTGPDHVLGRGVRRMEPVPHARKTLPPFTSSGRESALSIPVVGVDVDGGQRSAAPWVVAWRGGEAAGVRRGRVGASERRNAHEDSVRIYVRSGISAAASLCLAGPSERGPTLRCISRSYRADEEVLWTA
jgi:hypothetical protein